MSETKHYPPSASRSGTNAYYLAKCDIAGHAPSYAACLAKLDEIEKGSGKHTSCAVAVGLHRCQAHSMRAEELLQGRALYYVPRETIATNSDKSPAWSVVGRIAAEQGVGITTTVPKVATPSIPKPPVANLGGTYADAINAAMRTLPPSPQVTVTQTPAVAAAAIAQRTPAPAMQPGETPLAYARRVAASR